MEIPFEFVAGDQILPAGGYIVHLRPTTVDASVLAIQTNPSASDDEMRFRKVMVPTEPARETPAAAGKTLEPTEGEPRLVFKPVGDLQFLDAVITPRGDQREVG